jgi:Tol biopolymer transport system component
VPASGGEATPLKITSPRGLNVFVSPRFLADSATFVYVAICNDRAELRAHALDSGQDRLIGAASSQVDYVKPYLLFAREGTLFAQRFDAGTLHFDGEPTMIADGVRVYQSLRIALFTAAKSTIIYQTAALDSQVVEYDRKGTELRQIGPARPRFGMRVSPNGRRLAEAIDDPLTGTTHLWITDLTRNGTLRLTATQGAESLPAWSPDGRTLAFTCETSGPPHICAISSFGGTIEHWTDSKRRIQYLSDWTSDGRYILFDELSPTTKSDIRLLSATPPHTTAAWLQTPDPEGGARISPDGKWAAYQSISGNAQEIFVTSFPARSDPVQVSTGGGSHPIWSGDGKELFSSRRRSDS